MTLYIKSYCEIPEPPFKHGDHFVENVRKLNPYHNYTAYYTFNYETIDFYYITDIDFVDYPVLKYALKSCFYKLKIMLIDSKDNPIGILYEIVDDSFIVIIEEL